MSKTRKVLLFIFSIFSILGLFFGAMAADGYGRFALEDLLKFWIGFSIPLLIQIAFCIIFKKEKDKNY